MAVMTKKKAFRRFRHYHIPDVKIPATTVCIEELTPRQWLVSWSVCSTDDIFSRAKGRSIAIKMSSVRGYTVNVAEGEDAMDVAVCTLLKSKTMANDREVIRFREAMENLIHPDYDHRISKFSLKKYAHAKFNALASFLSQYRK